MKPELTALVELLEDEADRLSARGYGEGCCSPDCGISANLAREAANTLSSLLSRPTGEAVAQKPYAYELEYNDQFHQPKKGLSYGPYEPGEHPGEAIFRVIPLYTHPAPAQDEARVAQIALRAIDEAVYALGRAQAALTPSSEREGGR